MIPLRDTIPTRTFPVVTTSLIIINVLVFLVMPCHGRELQNVIFTYGLVPARYGMPGLAERFSFGMQALSMVSFMFLHGSFWHLLGNMWFLHIFGDNVEDELGPFAFLAFYLLCGTFSGVAHLVLNFHSAVPVIGASGAVAGVMGAYFIRYPRSRILTFIPILIIPYFIEVPAAFFLGIWFFFQFISAALTGAEGGGIAWWAHVGGFVAGVLFFKLFMFFPESGVTGRLRRITARRRSPRVRVVRREGSGGNDFYGTLSISPEEALRGTRKIISVPSGLRKRLFAVSVPSGVGNKQVIRLPELGRKIGDESGGDGYLTILIDRNAS
ncbi:MAG TPA: rhomboid family intramembrane serine protease [Deltaproteobacteria bacterium]|nr:rhomboid family intramembrane serine protease [Deltaproteobacteria bacterium]